MERLSFQPLPFGIECPTCEHEAFLDWVVPDLPDPRVKSPSCVTPMPDEIVSCKQVGRDTADYCKSRPAIKCDPIPELWTVKTVFGVDFEKHPGFKRVPGTTRRYKPDGTGAVMQPKMVPALFNSLAAFVTITNNMGLPIKTIISAGTHYCRCWKRPEGVCQSDGTGCTSDGLSNHATGHAIDITGVRWRDPAATGSSQDATMEKSWNDDPPEQSALVVRLNAALRLSFKNVFDYARGLGDSHSWHFHCDTNNGGGFVNYWKSNGKPSDPCEPYFIWGALKRLGYVARTAANKEVTWDKARAGLKAFATKRSLALPTTNDPPAWRPIIEKLLWCTVQGPPNCKGP